MLAVAITRFLDLGDVIDESNALAVNVDDLGTDGDHAEAPLIGGIAHFGIGQDRKVVELDAVMLAVLDQGR